MSYMDPKAFSHSAVPAAAAYRGDIADRVRRFLPMVRRLAWHVHGSGRDGIELEDLMQAGLVALTEAAQRHAGPGEDGFAAYAKMRVRGAMVDLIRRQVPLSRGTEPCACSTRTSTAGAISKSSSKSDSCFKSILGLSSLPNAPSRCRVQSLVRHKERSCGLVQSQAITTRPTRWVRLACVCAQRRRSRPANRQAALARLGPQSALGCCSA